MIKSIVKTSFALLLLCSLGACKKEKNTNNTSSPQNGTFTLRFNNVVGSSALVLNTQEYTSPNAEQFKVSKFNYYISNIKLVKADGSTYNEPESYHLIQASDSSSLQFSIANVPAASYKSIQFTIGVDSLRNVSGAQSGALDPAHGMFWSWSTGYIMFKLEGTSPQSTGSANKYQMHAGGFKGANSVIRTLDLSFDKTAEINNNTHFINLSADINKVLKGPNSFTFAATPLIMDPGETAKKLADNYAQMFSLSLSDK